MNANKRSHFSKRFALTSSIMIIVSLVISAWLNMWRPTIPPVKVAPKPAITKAASAPIRLQLSEAEALKIARDTMIKNGIAPSKYELYNHEIPIDEPVWNFLFARSGPVVADGDHFMIFVDDRDKSTAFVPGL